MAATDTQMLPNTVDIQLTRNPFEEGRVHSYAFEGETIEHMIVSRGLRLDEAHGILVAVGGELVPERMFSRVKPKAGVLVVIKVIPRGGAKGKAILQIVIGVLMVAASIYTMGTTGPQGWASLTAGAKAATVMGGISGLMTIGSGITSLVAPPPAVPFDGNIPQSADSAALTGTRNTARLHGPIRTVLGKYRVYPDLLGKPFVEQVGNDSILRVLMCFGYGPLDIQDIKIGETPIDELTTRYVVHEGWTDDPELTIFSDEVDMDSSVQVELKRIDEAGNPIVPSGIMTTGPDPKEISIDIAFPGGLIAFDKNGKPQDVTVRFKIEEREVGDVAWTVISDPTAGVNSSTGFKKVIDVGVTYFELKLSQRGSITRGLRWPVPAGSTAGAVHQVQITRVSTYAPAWSDDFAGEDNADGAIQSSAFVPVIKTIRPHISSDKIPNLAKIELEINASETGLSGVIDNLSATCTSIVPEFDVPSQSWGPTAGTKDALTDGSMKISRNAAWLFAHVLRGPANSRPIDDSRIDAAGLAVWAGNLDGVGSFPGAAIGGYPNNDTAQLGIKRYTDAVVDFSTTARKLLSDIAATGRASLNIIDGKYSVVQDIPQGQIIQHFNPRNSSGFSGSKAFRKIPHAVRVNFVNPKPNDGILSYQKDELIVYNDNYSEFGNPAVELEFRGSTTPTSILDGGPGAASAWRVSPANTTIEDQEGYAVRLTVTGTDPQFVPQMNNLLSIDADTNKFVRVRMRRVKFVNEPWSGQMFFHDVSTTSFTFGNEFQTNEPDWTKGWVTVVWDMSSNASWAGTIDRIRFDFVHGGTSFGSVFDIQSITVDDGTQAATEFGELSLWGVADAHQAYRDGRYHLASTKLRPEIFSITTDVEHLVANRGDLVRVSHDVIGVGYGAARLKSVMNVGGAFRFGTLDEEFFYESGKDYAMRIRGFTDSGEPDEAIINLVTQDGYSSDVVSILGGFQWNLTNLVRPAVGDLVMFGERTTESIECIVKSISPSNDLTAAIELVEYNAAVYETEADIPAHNSNITLESSPNILRPITPEIRGELVSDETVAEYSASGTPNIRILMNVSTPQTTANPVIGSSDIGNIGSYAATTHFHAQFRKKSGEDVVTDWINVPRVEAFGETEISIRPVEQDSVYDVRVRSISDSKASASEWLYRSDHVVIGLSTPPPAPTSLSVWGTAIRWEYGVKPSDFAGFIVKHQGGDDATWATGIPITTNLITDNWIQINGRIQYGRTTIMVRAVDVAGNESATLSAVKLIRTPEQLDDIKTETWTGVWGGGAYSRINCSIEVGTSHLIAGVESSGLFWRLVSAAPFWVTSGHVFWVSTTIYKEMSFLGEVQTRHDFADIAGANWPVDADFPCREYVSQIDTQGTDYKIEYRPFQSETGGTYTYFPGIDWAPWPGERTLDEPEFPILDAGSDVERLLIRFTIAGGRTQGKLKAAEFKVEGIKKTHREILTVATTGTLVDLTGKGFRKITSVSITPASTGSTITQAGVIGQAYDLLANQQPGGANTTYELSGPQVVLSSQGDASVTIEGY
jgi:predicted phage tail protein